MTSANESHTTPALQWEQLSLLREEVVEITLRIGVVLEGDHLQWQLDVRDPSSRTLLGMQSSPAVSAARWEYHLHHMAEAVRQAMRTHVDPF